METEVKGVKGGPVTYWNPDKNMLKDLTKFLKANPLVREVEIHSDDIGRTWMTYCMNYFEVVSAGGVVVISAETCFGFCETDIGIFPRER